MPQDKRFCHINNEAIRKTFQVEEVREDKKIAEEDKICDVCCTAEATKTTCKAVTRLQSNDKCDLMHLDLCDPMQEHRLVDVNIS